MCLGKKVNLNKSQLFVSDNVNLVFVDHLAQKVDIPLTKDLGRYLGVPSIHNRVSEGTFAKMIDRVKERLAG